jgi:hypothetical protein
MAFATLTDAEGGKTANIELHAIGNQVSGHTSPGMDDEVLQVKGTDYKDQTHMERLGKRQEFDVGVPPWSRDSSFHVD